jgi:hypothetical protein
LGSVLMKDRLFLLYPLLKIKFNKLMFCYDNKKRNSEYL